MLARRGHPMRRGLPTPRTCSIPSFVESAGQSGRRANHPATTFAVGDKRAFYSWRLGSAIRAFPRFEVSKQGVDQFLQSTVPIFSDNNGLITASLVALLDELEPGDSRHALAIGHPRLGDALQERQGQRHRHIRRRYVFRTARYRRRCRAAPAPRWRRAPRFLKPTSAHQAPILVMWR